MTGKPLLDPATVPADIRPLSVELVGAYGLRVHWSDGHGTGIYTFENLLAWCPCDRCRGATWRVTSDTSLWNGAFAL